MKRSAVLAALIAMGAAAYAAPAGAATRHYWVAAIPVTWNMIPNERDAIMGTRYEPSQSVFGTVAYRLFSRNWKRQLVHQDNGAGHDGLQGPLIRARVGDRIRVHFKNLDTMFNRPHSMHFHGVRYKPSSDGAYVPGFSGGDADVKPGKTWTYRLTAVQN